MDGSCRCSRVEATRFATEPQRVPLPPLSALRRRPVALAHTAQGGPTMDRQDDKRPDQDPKDRPFAALDDDEAPTGDTDAGPVTTASPLMAGISGGPPGALGSTGAAGE